MGAELARRPLTATQPPTFEAAGTQPAALILSFPEVRPSEPGLKAVLLWDHARMVLNPGSSPIPDATEEQATANMAAFADELRTQYDVNVASYVRAASSDYGDGRWAYEILTDDERRLTVQMPGAPLQDVREGRHRLYVDDDSWYWDFALSQCKPHTWEW